jgi:hypothetical protein
MSVPLPSKRGVKLTPVTANAGVVPEVPVVPVFATARVVVVAVVAAV